MKRLTQLLRTLRHKAVLYIFNRYYGKLIYSFENAEDTFQSLPDPAKLRYYDDVHSWLQSSAYDIENKGAIMQHYKDLAGSAVDPDILTAYRLVLLYIKNQDIRLRAKLQEYEVYKTTLKKSSNLK